MHAKNLSVVKRSYAAILPHVRGCQRVAVAPAGDDTAQFFTLRTAKALAMTALDLLLQPEAMQRVKQEFIGAKLKDELTPSRV